MWFLIAGEQITQAKNHVNPSMTMEQLLEAEQRAAEWIRKSKKILLRRSKILPTHLPPDSAGISHYSKLTEQVQICPPIHDFRLVRQPVS
jgi:hypothetical protein